MNKKLYYLMIKTIDQTGMKYLCKRRFYPNRPNDHLTYKGSGVLWRRILNKHPNYTISTEVLGLYTKDDLKKYGRYFSDTFNIVESDEWANLIPELGDGGATRKNTKAWINPQNNTIVFRDKCPVGFEKYYYESELKGSITYHNPVTKRAIRLKPGEAVPDGFVKGNVKGRGYGPRKGTTTVYHNGERKIYLEEHDDIPEGFVKGVHYEGTTKGKVGCHNPLTKEKRYINPNEDIPEGFVVGLFPTTGKRVRSPDGKIYKSVADAERQTGLKRHKILKEWVIIDD